MNLPEKDGMRIPLREIADHDENEMGHFSQYRVTCLQKTVSTLQWVYMATL
jgi:hypothetical protein